MASPGVFDNMKTTDEPTDEVKAYQTRRGDDATHLVFEGEASGAWLSSSDYVELQEVL